MNDPLSSTTTDSAPTTGTRAVIYLRVSTMGQDNTDYDADGFSIAAQRGACRQKAESLGATVVEEYVDKGESARSADRPQLQRMLLRLQQDHDVDYVITFKVDRIARNRDDDFAINLAIRQAGARLVSVSENIDDTPSGKLLHAVMAGVAEFYSANLSHEVSRKMVEKAKRGGTLSKAPIGYVNIREQVDGKEIRTVAIDEERAPHVRWAFEAYASGDYTTAQLHDALVDRGLTSRDGARRSKSLSRGVVAAMLNKRYYLGFVSYKGVEYPGRHEPLVDPITFARVQAQLALRRNGEKQRTHNHYLKSTVVCARCGARLCFGRSKGRRGDYYDYFFCVARQQKRNGCELPWLPAHEVEAAVEHCYRSLTLPAQTATTLRLQVEAVLAKRSAFATAERERQRLRLERLQREQDKILKLHYADALPFEKVAEEQRRIARESEDALRIIEAADIEAKLIMDNLDSILAELENPQAAYLSAGASARRLMNQGFFQSIAIDAMGEATPEISSTYAALLAEDLVAELGRELKNPDQRFVDRGSKAVLVVAGARTAR